MKTILLSALALGTFTAAASAEPVALTDAQMDRVTAGQWDFAGGFRVGDFTLTADGWVRADDGLAIFSRGHIDEEPFVIRGDIKAEDLGDLRVLQLRLFSPEP
jgi:hypothetical protein